MLPLLYMDTGRHTLTQTYTPPSTTETDKQTRGNTQADTYKHTH